MEKIYELNIGSYSTKIDKLNKISGLIISAGFSNRMGDFKPLLKYKSESFLKNIINKLDAICDKIIVITGHNRNLIEAEISTLKNKDKIKTHFNSNYKDGMFTSLQVGMKYSSNSDWVLYHFIDQPNLPQEFYSEFIEQIDNSFDWIQPKFYTRNGHPILINKRLIDIIISQLQTSNLKEITSQKNIKKKYWNCEYPEILNDIDTIDSYKKLIQ